MADERERLQIGEFAELVGLSIPQLRRYDRLRLLAPEGRTAAGYRVYGSGQTGAARVIALLRSMDMPLADVRRVLAGIDEAERQQLFTEHRARLEARLSEVQRLLDAVDGLTTRGADAMSAPNAAPTELSSWLHYLPHLPVSDIDASVAYYEEALGFRRAWQTADRKLTALASGPVEVLLLVPWDGDGPPPAQSAYVYVEDPDGLCAEYTQAGAVIAEPVATRSYGMRDFVVRDPDGHRFVIGRGDEALREVAAYYGLERDEIAVDPEWLLDRRPAADG
ncbi:MAG: MerR family DNA-binding transcriptional regulator [Actinomycetota bacterium]|nr:MerR family DNA-binding transcriptional regulator [Actinomycetota bacterium]